MDARRVTEFAISAVLIWPVTGYAQDSQSDPTTQSRQSPFSDCMARQSKTLILGTAVGVVTSRLAGIFGGNKSSTTDAQDVRGAAAGAVIGLVAAWGKCYSETAKISSEQVAGYDSAASQIGYEPRKGPSVEVRGPFIDPAAVPPSSGILRVVVPYYVLTPDPHADIEVLESQDLYIKNKQTNLFEKLGGTQEKVISKPGLRKGGGDIPLPENIDEGEYKITYTVTAQGKPSIAQLPFTITKDQNLLARAQNDALIARGKFEKIRSGGTQVAVAQTSVVPEEGTRAKSLQNTSTGELRMILVAGATATLRSQPDTTANIVATVKRGERYPFTETVQLAGKKWLLVLTDEGKKGWVSEGAVKVLP